MLKTLRLGTFHIGSSFADILSSSVWNYVMANNMAGVGGFIATPVTLLLALRQILVPVTLYAGHLSDTRPVFGYRRLPYIWLGRGMMLLSMLLLPVATSLIFNNNFGGWVMAFFVFVIYGVGTQTSGSPFIALVRDSAPKPKQGMAYAVVQTMLVGSFAFSPLIYARLAQAFLPDYQPTRSALSQYNLDLFWFATVIGFVVAFVTWVVSVLGSEKRYARSRTHAVTDDYRHFTHVFKVIFKDKRARNFFVLLSLGAMSGFAQDGVLEPSLREVFGYSFSQTATVTGFWGAGLLIGLIGSIGLTRKWATVEQTRVAYVGLIVSALSLLWMAVTSISMRNEMILPSVTAFGVGFGVYTAGGSPLLMVMTLDKRAGAYMGLWSMAQLLSRGVGIALGGVFYDLFRVFGASTNWGYGGVFLLEAFGFLVCIYFLRASQVKQFAKDADVPATAALDMAD